MITRENKDQVSGAVFLIGLGVLFTPLGAVVGGFFPGILFVIGATALVHSMAEGEGQDQRNGGLFLLGLGLFFLLGFNLPLLLIGLGIFLLLGYHQKPEWFGSRRHDSREGYDSEVYTEKQKHDEYV